MLICDKELRDLWEIFATIPANPQGERLRLLDAAGGTLVEAEAVHLD
jgi:hypothetical protein